MPMGRSKGRQSNTRFQDLILYEIRVKQVVETVQDREPN